MARVRACVGPVIGSAPGEARTGGGPHWHRVGGRARGASQGRPRDEPPGHRGAGLERGVAALAALSAALSSRQLGQPVVDCHAAVGSVATWSGFAIA